MKIKLFNPPVDYCRCSCGWIGKVAERCMNPHCTVFIMPNWKEIIIHFRNMYLASKNYALFEALGGWTKSFTYDDSTYKGLLNACYDWTIFLGGKAIIKSKFQKWMEDKGLTSIQPDITVWYNGVRSTYLILTNDRKVKTNILINLEVNNPFIINYFTDFLTTSGILKNLNETT